jgi:hypothetical protein
VNFLTKIPTNYLIFSLFQEVDEMLKRETSQLKMKLSKPCSPVSCRTSVDHVED